MKTESEIRAEPHSRRAPEGRGSKPTSSSPARAVGGESAVHGANVPCVAAGRKDQRHPAVRVEVTTPFPQTERRRHLNNLWSPNATDYSISHHENPCFSAISGHHTSCIPPHTHALDSPSILNEVSWPEVRSDSHTLTKTSNWISTVTVETGQTMSRTNQSIYTGNGIFLFNLRDVTSKRDD